MTISTKEILDDFERFLRHEAMRANESHEYVEFVVNNHLKYRKYFV